MALKDAEDELFERWATSLNISRDKFVKDGVADEALYNKSRYKILFLAKETNNTKKEWDTRERLAAGVYYKKDAEFNLKKPISKTFNNIYRWANLFLNDIGEYSNFKKVPSGKNQQERQNIFASIGMMNLKKITGKESTVDSEVSDFVDNNKKYINEQISLYNPNIIICCGRGVYSGLRKSMGILVDENKSNGKFRTSILKNDNNETVIIDFYHPQSRTKIISQYNILKNIKNQYNL